MKINPLFDRVVIEEFNGDEKTASGLILPSSVVEKPQMAKVIAVGEDVKVVKENDTILYAKYAGIEYKFNNKKYTIIRQGDILAVVIGD